MFVYLGLFHMPSTAWQREVVCLLQLFRTGHHGHSTAKNENNLCAEWGDSTEKKKTLVTRGRKRLSVQKNKVHC